MDIGYRDFDTLGRHLYVLTFVDHTTFYECTNFMHAFSGADVIQALKEFSLDEGRCLSKIYTYFDKKMIWGASHKLIIGNGSKKVAYPEVHNIQKGLVKRT